METSASTPSSFGQYLQEAKFQYSDCLDDQKIRLLELNFGHSDEIVCLDVQTYSIDDYPPYIALSYTWGDPNDTVNVSCNGKTLAVTRNLQEALWQFRENRKRLVRLESSTTSRGQLLHFWVDAICIDQKCNKEKSFQVGMMGNIYQQARHVFTWLGPADKSSDVAIRCIDTIGKMAEDCGFEDDFKACINTWREMAFVSRSIEQRLSIDPVMRNAAGSLSRVSYKALKVLFDMVSGWNNQINLLPITELKDFFTRPWWTRMWVLQEVALSRDTYFICGTQRTPRTPCSALMNMFVALQTIIIIKYDRDQKSLNLYQREIMENLFQHNPGVLLFMPKVYRPSTFSLAALLHLTSIDTTDEKLYRAQSFKSTKPEDKIFALLGLAADREELKRYGVVPNYDIPYQQTYATTMAALLQQGHISLLSMCQTLRSPDLPSWAPDWSRSFPETFQRILGDVATVDPTFNCSGRREYSSSTIKVFNDQGTIRRISIRSYLYDEVHQVGYFTNRRDMEPSLFEWSVTWLLEILRLSYCSKKDYEGFHDRLCASARTCTGDIESGKDSKRERVGNDRYSDAVLLLQEGLTHIAEGRFKLDAHRFLTNQTLNSAFRDVNLGRIRLAREILKRSTGRLPFVTRKGHIGLSSQHVIPGDTIAIIEGGQVPFVFRREDKGQFSLISEAYVDGIMDGEVADTGDYSYVTLV